MEMSACCSAHMECQTTGQCVHDRGVMTDGLGGQIGCQLWGSTVAFPFPALYKLKQKGFITIEQNYLLEDGEKYLFQHWNDQSDIVFILNAIYVLQMTSWVRRLDPATILAIAKQTKEDSKRWRE